MENEEPRTDSHQGGRMPRLGQHVLVLLGFGLVAILITYPLAFVGSTAIAGTTIAEKDGWQKIWDLWWFQQAILQGNAPFWSRYLFWPLGVNLLIYQTYAPTTLISSLPVLLAFGPVAAYKFSMLFNFTLSGYTMALLARHYTRRWWPALVAGLLYLATPVHLARFADGSHLNAMQWLPLYLLLLALWLQYGRPWQGMAATGLLVVLFFTSLYYTQFALIWTVAAVPVYALVTRQPWHVGLRAALVVAGWALLCLPVLQYNLSTPIHYRDWLFRQENHSLDLIDLLLPSDVHPLWSRFHLHRFTHPYGSWNVVPGIGVLLVGSYGLWRQRARVWPWAVLALVMLLFAFGPTLHVADYDLGLPMPHSLLNLTNAGKGSHRPDHFMVPAIVVLSLGVALALQQRRLPVILAVGGLIFMLDCLPPVPWPVIRAAPPSWQPALQQLPPGALVQLPFQPREIDYQLAQLWHGRPITGGYVSRTPPDPVRKLPILNRLTGITEPTIVGGDEATQLRRALGGLCAAGLVIHSDPTRADALPLQAVRQNVAALLPEARLLAADDPLVYALPDLPPMPLLLPGEGWYRLEQDETRRWQWTAPQSDMLLVNPLVAPLTVQVQFEVKAPVDDQTVRIWLDDMRLWQGQVGRAPWERSFWLRLAPQQVRRLTFQTERVQEQGTGERELGLVFTAIGAETAAAVEPASACPPAPALPPGIVP